MTIAAPAYGSAELAVMRVGFGAALWKVAGRLAQFDPSATLSHPIGVGRLVDLRPLLPLRSKAAPVVRIAAVAYLLTGPVPPVIAVLAVVLVLGVTMAVSEGAVSHANYLVVLVAAVQLAASVAWTITHLDGWSLGSWAGESLEDTAVWWTVQAILSAYFISGLSKLIRSKGRWIARSPGLLVSAMASTDNATMGSLRQVRAAERQRRIVETAWAHAGLARLVFAGGLIVEVGAPVGLVAPAVLTAVGVGLIGLHQGNRLLLSLSFPIWQCLVLAYLVDLPRYFT